MNKRQFIAPYIMLSAGTGGNGGDSGFGSVHGGQGGNFGSPMSANAWYNSDYAENLVGETDVIDFADYATWWYNMWLVNPNLFNLDAWLANGNTEEDWDDYIGN